MPEVVRSPVTSMPVITAKRRVPLESRTRSLFHTTRSRSPCAVVDVGLAAGRRSGSRRCRRTSRGRCSTRSGRVIPSHSGRPTISSSRKPVSRKVAGFARTHGAVERGHDDDRVRGVQGDVGELALLGEPVRAAGRAGRSPGTSGQRHQGGADQVGLHQRAGHRGVDELAADADGERSATAGGQERGEDAQRQQLPGDDRGPEPQAGPDQQRQRQERQRQLLLAARRRPA